MTTFFARIPRLSSLPSSRRVSSFRGVIPMDAVERRFSLSSGPGGQNVQKNATKAEIRFKVDEATWLPDQLKQPLKESLRNRINQHGELIIDSDKTRERSQNLEDCFAKLRDAIFEVQKQQNSRQETEVDRELLKKKAGRAAQHRLAEKRRLSQKKAFRSGFD